MAVVCLLAACTGGITGGVGGDDDDDDGDGADGGGGGGDGSVDEGPYEGELGTILFATQVPVGGLGTLSSPFGNHLATVESAPRGGDLMIRYPDGTLRNLTREAGFGEEGEMQAADAIAVREPCVHFSGNRALFSMIVGAIREQYDQRSDFYWQVYEVTGLARDQEVQIRRVDGQPAEYNNVSPIYGSDGKILFASDRPRSGEAHLYPQLDEYESMATTTGIYRLDEATGDLEMVEHSPSGVFSLSLDTHGRVLFTKWDHLQRDQQGDTEEVAGRFQPVTFSDETASAATTTDIVGTEVFPEQRDGDSVDSDPAMSGHRFNQFFAWEMNQDGSAEETLNHVGRQEWGGTYSDGNFRDDDNLSYEAEDVYRGGGSQLRGDGGAFHIRQDPVEPQWYLATEAAEFGTGTGGRLVRLQGDPTINAEDMRVEALTADPDESGYFRNPLRLTDGTYVAVHAASGGDEEGLGYRMAVLAESGDRLVASQRITGGVERTVSWWSPDNRETFSGILWELDPVEVAPREVPPVRASELPPIEQAVFAEVGVSAEELSTWLRERELALVVSRNVTQRDRNDVQQPYNLRVPGGTSSIATGGTVYDVSHIQFFQGDQVRGYGDDSGRRVLARPMHGAELVTDPVGPSGSVAVGADGSMAAFVPARRAMSWQLVGPDGGAVVRERNWVSFRAGEIRVCASCHGINRESQTGDSVPQNSPEALRGLLQAWLADQ
jgi:hypothetical protein